MVVSLKILINDEFSKASMDLRVVKDQNEHNNKN